MMRDMERWESREGVAFLRRVGVRKGHTILDFGARVGHYTIPAAAVAGPKGKVYAFEKNPKALAELARKRAVWHAGNVVVVETTGEIDVNLAAIMIDTITAIDTECG